LRCIAVFDTNVVLDITCAKDFFDSASNAVVRLGEAAAMNDDDVVFRRHRARESMAAALHVADIRGKVFCLDQEITKVQLALVPPKSPKDDPKLHFAIVFFQFVREWLLRRWVTVGDRPEPMVKGNAADTFLVRRASELGVPFVSNEGLQADGSVVVEKGGARAKAIAAGVPVYTPREFSDARRVDRERLFNGFLERFETRGHEFLRGRKDARLIGNSMSIVHGIYRHVFFGETPDGLPQAKFDL
jgi:hypothetical protein